MSRGRGQAMTKDDTITGQILPRDVPAFRAGIKPAPYTHQQVQTVGAGFIPARTLVSTQGVFDDRISLVDTKVPGNNRTLGLQEIKYRPLLTGECFVVSLSFAND